MIILGCADPEERSTGFWDCLEDPRIQYVSDIANLQERLSGSTLERAVVVRVKEANADLSLFARVREAAPGRPVIAWVGKTTPQDAFRLSQLGADALITDQTPADERVRIVESACSHFAGGADNTQESDEAWRKHLVGNGSAMSVVCELIRLVSQRRCTVLITGETGSGKELVARAIHTASPRAAQPMVSINCNAIPSELLEAELFGHVKGAYTGAYQSRIGRFEQANRGTLFLDEIGDMPFPLQAKLLRALQEREIHRLGSSETVKVDVRVIAATNANLSRLVEQGKFRQDLYYRLHVAPIHVPPLRERMEDIPGLVNHFVQKICKYELLPVKTVPREIIEWMQTMPWPGNVRELENTVESAIAVNGRRPSLRMADFPALLGEGSHQSQLFAMPLEGIDYNAVVGRFERTLLAEALRLADGSKKQAASLLKLKRTTFSAKLDALHIGKEEGVREDSEEAGSDAAGSYPSGGDGDSGHSHQQYPYRAQL